MITASIIKELRQRGQNETKTNVNKNMRTYLLSKEKGMSSIE